ncbi:head completion/stabilization protein [Thiomicrorhabdus sp.]|uniref:head completion/stabilization protein n=1 Tax=Thiomicrorhabdus sp. TaxID=2039724 RepID=UPI003561BA1B
MQFVGDKGQTYTTELSATPFYPVLKLADFQQQFNFLEDQNEYAVTQQAIIDRSTVHRQLLTLTETHQNLVDVSKALFGDDTTAAVLYQNAVFSMTAANLIGNRMATDATKEAADRQEALNQKVDHLNSQARSSIEQLLRADSGYAISLI